MMLSPGGPARGRPRRDRPIDGAAPCSRRRAGARRPWSVDAASGSVARALLCRNGGARHGGGPAGPGGAGPAIRRRRERGGGGAGGGRRRVGGGGGEGGARRR